MRNGKWVIVMLAAIALPALAEEASAPPAPVPTPAEPVGIEPAFVRPLVAVESGRNDSNPVWSPAGDVVAFERSRGDDKEIVITRLDGSVVETIYFLTQAVAGAGKFFFPGVVDRTSYNAGITWSPRGDRFVFMSNGGEGNYDLYLREPETRVDDRSKDSAGTNPASRFVRLTTDKEKDGQAHWSPTQDRIAFISGRGGKGDVYVLDLATKITTALTHGERQPYLYPQWSPDGKHIVAIRGTSESHHIYLLQPGQNPPVPPKALTTWRYDDLRPTWSPDGKRVAFYTNYNAAGDPKTWAIAVVAADGSDPTEGEGLIARIVATDVIPDVERGPAWTPDGRRILYVRNEKQAYNPIYVVDIESRANTLVRSGTKINHDITCARDGTVAFRAQVDQWDQIFVMKLKD